MAHEHDHSHGALKLLKTDVDDETLASLRVLHPALADNLLMSRRLPALNDDERAELARLQQAVETHDAWSPGYHAAGDMCAGCGTPTRELFFDVFEQGGLPYAAFVGDVPVHPRTECIDALAAKVPRRSPQAMDQLRRRHAKDLDRPTAHMSQFFRHDLLRHPPFELEDWANSVAEANGGRLDRQTAKDIERLLAWVHQRMFH